MEGVKGLLITVFLFTSWQFSNAYDDLDSDTVTTIKAAIKTCLSEEPAYHARALRLIFHDCVSDTCDGCINLDNSSNEGLDTIIDVLEDCYEDYEDTLSRADFWALAAIKAIEIGVAAANGGSCTYGDCPVINMPTFTFKYGRTDCDDSPYTTDEYEFPEGNWDRDTMMDYFEDHFGYTEDEVVALMGAHSIGRNRLENSGYLGAFDDTSTSLDVQYYQDMLDSDITWTNEETDAGKYQFACTDSDGDDCGTRLNTDLELVYDLSIDDDDGSCSCTPGDDCDTADTYSTVYSYANDADTWAEDFYDIMEKLMSTGYDDLTEVS